jgi:hypothetical protein
MKCCQAHIRQLQRDFGATRFFSYFPFSLAALHSRAALKYGTTLEAKAQSKISSSQLFFFL